MQHGRPARRQRSRAARGEGAMPLPRPLSSGVVLAATACTSRGAWPSCGGQARCHPDTPRSPLLGSTNVSVQLHRAAVALSATVTEAQPRSGCDHHHGRSHRAACLTEHRVIAISYDVSDGEVDATCSQVVRRSWNLDRRRWALPPPSSVHARSTGCDEAEHDSPAGRTWRCHADG